MSEYVTYRIRDSAGRYYYVTTDMMDVENLWYRGNSNLNLSENGQQYTQRRSLISNSQLISNPGSGSGGTTYTTIQSIEVVGTTDGVQQTWAGIAVMVIIVVVVFLGIAKRKGGKKKWQNY